LVPKSLKFERYKLQSIDQILAEVIQTGGETLYYEFNEFVHLSNTFPIPNALKKNHNFACHVAWV
jgi:hypothetical protein